MSRIQGNASNNGAPQREDKIRSLLSEVIPSAITLGLQAPLNNIAHSTRQQKRSQPGNPAQTASRPPCLAEEQRAEQRLEQRSGHCLHLASEQLSERLSER